MTWSIIARDAATRRIGIVVATRFFAVGALVPYVRTGVGAVATQALINPHLGPMGLDLLATGVPVDAAVAKLAASDAGREQRQFHVMDAGGRSAAYTGAGCIDWCGHTIGAGYSIAGNMLAGPEVIAATAAAYERGAALPFARRLIFAMHAGEAAGGDKRGKQSAALLIHDDEAYPFLDLRVDDHSEPLAELDRLEAVSRERFVHFRRAMPSGERPAGIHERAELERLVARSIDEGFQ